MPRFPPSVCKHKHHQLTRARPPGFALYRALMRQVPRISLPSDLTSRSDWINPIHYLIRSGFRRNRNDTSPRLVTSALKAGYRFLSLFVCAQDASSASHAKVIHFLRERQKAFPPPRPSATPVVMPKPRPPPLLTKISGPGEPPVYKSTVRPLPLSQLSGGTRKVPMLEDVQSIPFLRIGKPQSHSLANFLKRKGVRRQLRITALQELWEDRRLEASTEDMWEAILEELADREGVYIPDVGDEGGSVRVRNGRVEAGPFEWAVRKFGVDHVSAQLNEELVDMQARATAMLDLRDEEQRMAELEKRERRERRRAAWEERVSLGNEQAPLTEAATTDRTSLTPEQPGTGKQ